MKLRDIVIVSIIALNFSWLGWRMYRANHLPLKQVTTISAQELIGNAANLSGNPDARYVVVEFGDYQCPPCARMYTQIEEFTKQYPGKIRFQFRHYPLPSHNLAFPAALMAEKARRAGKFEALHKALYAMGARLDEDTLQSLAVQYGITYTSTDEVKQPDKPYEAIIVNDKRIGNKIPIDSTPSLFLCTPDHKVYQLYTIQQVGSLIR